LRTGFKDVNCLRRKAL